jgi:hypothetical protein
MNDDLMTSSRTPAGDPLAWLLRALRAADGDSDAFRARCLEVADAAFAVAQLRQVRRQTPWSPVAVSAFLCGLAALARVSLAPVLNWAGLSLADLDRPADPGFARAWSRLASALDLGFREALLHLRLTFAAEAGTEPLPSLARLRGTVGRATGALLDESEDFLNREMARWDEGLRARALDSERAFEENYRTASLAEDV